jgi:hypothetical protein
MKMANLLPCLKKKEGCIKEKETDMTNKKSTLLFLIQDHLLWS